MDISSSTSETEGEHEEQYETLFLVWLGSVAALGGFLFGYDTSSIAGAQLYFTDTWPNITTSEIATIVSLALIGAAIGSLFSGYVSDLIGRKKVILFADVMFTAGSIIMAIAEEIWILMVGRLVVGIGVGVAAQIVPLYLSEVAPTKVRGKLIATNNAMICVGQLISVILVLLLIPDWRFMLGIAAVPSTLQFIGILFLPESPRWLIRNGRDSETRTVISKIYKPNSVERKMKELRSEAHKLSAAQVGPDGRQMGEWGRIKSLSTTYLRCLVIGCSLQAAQQFSGINTCMYYGPKILIEAHINIGDYSESVTGLILNVPLSAVNALGSILSIFFIDRLGRRYSMLRALPFITLWMLVIASGMFLQNAGNDWGGYVAFGGLMLYLMTFSLGMSSPPWTICAEIFPLHVIGTANSLTTTTNWVSNSIVAEVFPIMLDKEQLKGWAFVLIAIFATISWFFVYIMVPETANKEVTVILEEILGSDYKERQERRAKLLGDDSDK